MCKYFRSEGIADEKRHRDGWEDKLLLMMPQNNIVRTNSIKSKTERKRKIE